MAMVGVLAVGCSREGTPSERREGGAVAVALDASVVMGTLREGDIVLQTSRSSQSAAIQIATKSRFSHMGLVQVEGASTYVYEAVGPVRRTAFDSWVTRGDGGHYTVMRLGDASVLTPAAVVALRGAERRFEGRPYDLAFAWSDDQVYCSELVWKVYRDALGIELAPLQHMRDFDLGDPVVAAKVRERFGGRVPMDELVIAPASIAASPLLVTVYER